jgi:predicted DNA-binding transcriptional regulator AlpA
MHPREYAELKKASRSQAGASLAHSLSETSSPAQTRTTPAQAPKSCPTRPIDDDALLTSAQTRARMGGVSTMCIWRWMRDPRVRFPHPVKINSRNYWRIGDLRRWQAESVTKPATATGAYA